MNNYIVIMAGGVGSRFWPASRERLPKQFLDILGIGKSLIRMTYDRSLEIVPKGNIFIATNAKYKELVKEHLPGIKDNNILLEPSRNNTAPCIAYSLLKIRSLDQNSAFAVLPSDHVILKEEEFVRKMNKAFDYVSTNDVIVTLGISPSRPDTGYGYIKTDMSDDSITGFFPVERFTEKPNLDTAKEFLSSGEYLWNAGIFVWSSNTLSTAFEKHCPDILSTLSQDLSRLNTVDESEYINKVYPHTKSISIDYAILEPAQNVYTIPAEIGWSDLGTWNSLYEYMEADTDGNVVLSGVRKLDKVKNCLIRVKDKKIIVLKGLEDYIIIDENDALLIYPKGDEQEIKAVRNKIEDTSFL